MAGGAELGQHAGAIRIAAQPDAVRPGTGIGDAQPQVGYRPGHPQVLAAGGGSFSRDGLHLQIGIRNRHHIQGGGRLGGVVAFSAVFPDFTQAVGADEDMATPRIGRAEAVSQGAAVGLPGLQRAFVADTPQHQIVAVADDFVLAEHDQVGPG